MKRPTEPVRSYNFTDGEMFEKANVIKVCFTADMTDFSNFDADFNQTYLDDLTAKILSANKVPQDNQVIDQLAQKTDLVEKIMDECRIATQKSKYFIEKAFPNNRSKWNEFGYNDYQEARNSQLKMIQYMKVVCAVSNTNKDALLAVGFTQANIDELNTLSSQLDAANIDQQVFMKERTTLANQRVELMNKVWEVIQHICKVGKIIYADDYSRYQQYVMYEKRSNDDPEVVDDPTLEV
ncbi:MAG: hypothetical protein K8S23_13940 [Candidatus Cloacimonetes bacterium]|nr:hypothetical protein [Candidatus Cloacimonadota bacterium]